MGLDIDTNLLYARMIFGAFGLGYFTYGKKNNKVVALLSGIILMAYPYFVTNIYYVIAIGIFFVILPFIIRA
ncbi:MAG: hypothetical protein PHR68_05475 [Candidatus Gracilibacteria bacterium]|nr:hypothetical protein [Candidatus Gracilibacteria bacterium]